MAKKKPRGTSARVPVRSSKGRKKEKPTAQWDLKLYVAGQTPRSVAALSNLKKICEIHMAGLYRIEIIDLLVKPQLAKGDQILAVPTLVRRLPTPIKKIIGDLSDTQKVLVGLNITPLGSE